MKETANEVAARLWEEYLQTRGDSCQSANAAMERYKTRLEEAGIVCRMLYYEYRNATN